MLDNFAGDGVRCSVGEIGFWTYLGWAALHPFTWFCWVLALAGLWSSWRSGEPGIGAGCLAAAWHAGLALVVWDFGRTILDLSQSSCTIGFTWNYVWWYQWSVLLPLVILTAAALPSLLRQGGMGRYLPAIASILIGFCASTLCIFGVFFMLVTPVAALRAWLP